METRRVVEGCSLSSDFEARPILQRFAVIVVAVTASGRFRRTERLLLFK